MIQQKGVSTEEPEVKPRVARAVRTLQPSALRRFFDRVAEIDGVISLGVGEPDFVTPERIRAAGIAALENGCTRYTNTSGLRALRAAIAEAMRADYELEYDPDSEVLVTLGVSEAVDLSMRAFVEPGDEVVVFEPCYISYAPCARLAGGVPVSVPTRAEDGFRVPAERLAAAITPRTRVLLLNYPGNPTGATFRREDLEVVAEVARRHDLVVVSDEIYAALTYTGPHLPLAALPGMRERTVLLNGFSKAYAMTGWRIGYACGPADLVAGMARIHQYTMLCAPMPSQMAALEALRDGAGDRAAMIAEYDARRRFFVRRLNEIGLTCHEPEGAFYAFPSIAVTGLTSEEFAEGLLQEERVAVLPGSAFGAAGEGHVRCSYASSRAHLEEALRRMERFVRRHARP